MFERSSHNPPLSGNLNPGLPKAGYLIRPGMVYPTYNPGLFLCLIRHLYTHKKSLQRLTFGLYANRVLKSSITITWPAFLPWREDKSAGFPQRPGALIPRKEKVNSPTSNPFSGVFFCLMCWSFGANKITLQ